MGGVRAPVQHVGLVGLVVRLGSLFREIIINLRQAKLAV